MSDVIGAWGAPPESLATLLVVEDEVLVRMHISDYLRDCGYRVIEAASGDEALVVLQEPELQVDMVLSEVEMPGETDGVALARWVRANTRGLPIVLVGTASGAADAAAELCESGPMLSKPYDPQILLDRIKRTLAERKPPQASG